MSVVYGTERGIFIEDGYSRYGIYLRAGSTRKDIDGPNWREHLLAHGHYPLRGDEPEWIREQVLEKAREVA